MCSSSSRLAWAPRHWRDGATTLQYRYHHQLLLAVLDPLTRIVRMILLIGCRCGARSATNLRSHSIKRIRQNNQEKIGPVYDGVCCGGWTIFWKGSLKRSCDTTTQLFIFVNIILIIPSSLFLISIFCKYLFFFVISYQLSIFWNTYLSFLVYTFFTCFSYFLISISFWPRLYQKILL